VEPDGEPRVGASLPYRMNSGTHFVTGGASSSKRYERPAKSRRQHEVNGVACSPDIFKRRRARARTRPKASKSRLNSSLETVVSENAFVVCFQDETHVAIVTHESQSVAPAIISAVAGASFFVMACGSSTTRRASAVAHPHARICNPASPRASGRSRLNCARTIGDTRCPRTS